MYTNIFNIKLFLHDPFVMSYEKSLFLSKLYLSYFFITHNMVLDIYKNLTGFNTFSSFNVVNIHLNYLTQLKKKNYFR